MAMKSMLMLFLFFFFMVAIAEGRSPIGFVQVNGTLYCTSNGAPAGTAPVFSGASVEVECTSNVVVDAPMNATTNSKGFYNVLLIPRSNGTVAALVSNCRLLVLTPLSNCNPNLPSATLVSNIEFVETVTFIFLRVTYMIASAFTLQS